MKKVFCLLFALSLYVGVNAQFPPSNSQAYTDSSDQIADKIIKSKKPVLIDFWASWCMPCRMLNPIIKELEGEYKGKVMFMKINIDMHRAIASHFGVRAIPAVFIVHNKSVVNALNGLRAKEDYKAALDEVLLTASKEKEKSKDSTQVKDTTKTAKKGNTL